MSARPFALVLMLVAAGLFGWGAGMVHWAAGVAMAARLADRMGGPTGRADAVVAMIGRAALLLGMAVGLWRGGMGEWTLVLAAMAALALALEAALRMRRPAGSAWLRLRLGPVMPGDALFLIGPLVWFGWSAAVFVAGCLAALLFLTVRVSVYVLKG